MTHDLRKHHPAPGFYLAIALALLGYLSVAGTMLYLLSSGRLQMYGVGNLDRAKQRIDHCRTKEEIRAILHHPTSENRQTRVWHYGASALDILVPHPTPCLVVVFDAQDQVKEIRLHEGW